MLNRERYSLVNRPEFKYGDLVEVDMSVLDEDNERIITGKVVGIGIRNIIDHWLIEFEESFEPTYPFRVASIPHIAILKV